MASSPHVAVVCFPLASHPSTLLSIARALALAAPSAVVSFLGPPQSIASLPAPLRTTTLTPNLRLCGGIPVPDSARPHEVLGLFCQGLPGNLIAGLEAAVAEAGGLRVSCVVADGLMPVVGEVVREMGVPYVPVRFCGPTLVLAHFYSDELRRSFEGQDMGEEAVSFIPSLSALRVRDLPSFILEGRSNPLNRSVADEYPQAAAVVNTFEGLDPLIDAELRSKFKNYLPVGPTNLLIPPPAPPEGDQCMSWLDRQAEATVVYISFGTFNAASPAEMAELAAGLEASGAPFLWSLKESERGGLESSGFLKRVEEGKGLVVNWAPQVHVLGHRAVGAFVTHGGWNSVTEGIASGLPMACRPFRWDQLMNARMVTDVYRIGITLNSECLTKAEVSQALSVLLKEEEGRKMRERSRALSDMAWAAAAPGGSSAENFKRLVDVVCARQC